MMETRKSFRSSLEPDNPAMQFISPPPEPEPETKPGRPPEGYKLNPIYIETKTRRVQLLMQPSLFEKIKTRAENDGCSVNELIHALLEKTLDK